MHTQLLRLFVTHQPRAGNHQRHTRARNVSLPTQANHTVRGARKQPPKWGATHAASEDTTHIVGIGVSRRFRCIPVICRPCRCGELLAAPEQFWPSDGPASAGLRQEQSQLRTHVGLSGPRGEVVDDVCLRTVLPQSQTGTSRATAASHLRSITAFHDGSSPLKRARQHKARLLSCASRGSWIWLTALPIHNALTLSNSAFCNAFQF